MSPAILAVAGSAWAQHPAHWGGPQLSGAGFFWLGVLNVALLMAFLAIVAQRRDRAVDGLEHPADLRTASPATGSGSITPDAAAAPAAVPAARPDDATARRQEAPWLAVPVSAVPARRASDADREEAAGTVSRAIALGCLDVDEGMGRIDAVYRSRYRHQLASLVADLPGEPKPAPSPRVTGFHRDLRDFGVLAVVAAIALQVLTGMWELWPIAVGALLPFAFHRHPTSSIDDRRH
ncbi:MAG: DUF1707 SHOCT-like domain-containing protein [Acidimicrobiales bacterium]